MVVLSEKDLGLVPPPPYFAIEHGGDLPLPKASSSALSPSPSCSHLPQSSSSSTRPTPQRAPALPSHILLLIVYSTLPQAGELRLDRSTGLRARESAEDRAVRTTRTMYWMAFCLRAVNRGFYLGELTHILIASCAVLISLVFVFVKLLCIYCGRRSFRTTCSASVRRIPPTRSRIPLFPHIKVAELVASNQPLAVNPESQAPSSAQCKASPR